MCAVGHDLPSRDPGGACLWPGEEPGPHELHQRGLCQQARHGVPGGVLHREPGGDQCFRHHPGHQDLPERGLVGSAPAPTGAGQDSTPDAAPS